MAWYDKFRKCTRLTCSALFSDRDLNITRDFDAKQCLYDADYIEAVRIDQLDEDGNPKTYFLYGRQLFELRRKDRIDLAKLSALVVEVDDQDEFERLCYTVRGYKLQLDHNPQVLEEMELRDGIAECGPSSKWERTDVPISFIRVLLTGPDQVKAMLDRLVNPPSETERTFEQFALDDAVMNLSLADVVYAYDPDQTCRTIVYGKQAAADGTADVVVAVSIERHSEQLDMLLKVVELFKGSHEYQPDQDWDYTFND